MALACNNTGRFCVIKQRNQTKTNWVELLNNLLKIIVTSYLKLYRCARGVIVIVVGNGHGDTSSNSGQDWYISNSTDTLGKCMNPIILLPAMGK